MSNYYHTQKHRHKIKHIPVKKVKGEHWPPQHPNPSWTFPCSTHSRLDVLAHRRGRPICKITFRYFLCLILPLPDNDTFIHIFLRIINKTNLLFKVPIAGEYVTHMTYSHCQPSRTLLKTLPKALRTQVLTAFTSNFGLVGLVQYDWLGNFDLVW